MNANELELEHNEVKYWTKVYFTSKEYGKELVAVTKYASDGIAAAQKVNYAISGVVSVEYTTGEVCYTREI